MPEITEDALLAGRVRLLQPAGGHRAGTDAVILAAAVEAKAGDVVVDCGAATGAVGLMLAHATPGIRPVFVERDPDLAALCRRNCELNGVDGFVAVADLLDAGSRWQAGLQSESAAWVVTNPPFLEEGRNRVSPDARRAAAHALPPGGLGEWLAACAALLKTKGSLALIHRADRLNSCLNLLGRGFGGVRLRFVHPRAEEPAIRVVLTAVKGSRAPLGVLPPLILHGPDGRFTQEADALHRGTPP